VTDESSEPADADLLRLVADGDRDAFRILYRRYRDMVHGFAMQMTGDGSAADDVTQETFLGLSDGAPGFSSERAQFSTYLYGIVRNLTRRRLRRNRVFVTLSAFNIDRWRSREANVEQSLVSSAGRQERIARVRRAVLSLPPRYREVIVLCDLRGHSYEEAAEIVRCAVGTLRSRLHRGRELLRKKLSSSGGPQ
jgi:RNA polymerase sigma-70 factor, ECF subfamily